MCQSHFGSALLSTLHVNIVHKARESLWVLHATIATFSPTMVQAVLPELHGV